MSPLCAYFAFGLLVAFPGLAFAGFETMDAGRYAVDGYEIECAARQKGGEIQLRGRIRYGDHCQRLKLTFTLRSEDGKKTKAFAEVGDVGGTGSRTIRTETSFEARNVRGAVPEWDIVRIQSRCLD
jgi:hypothetical protein